MYGDRSRSMQGHMFCTYRSTLQFKNTGQNEGQCNNLKTLVKIMYTSIEGQANSMFQGQASVRCLIRGQGHWLITHQIGQNKCQGRFFWKVTVSTC